MSKTRTPKAGYPAPQVRNTKAIGSQRHSGQPPVKQGQMDWKNHGGQNYATVQGGLRGISTPKYQQSPAPDFGRPPTHYNGSKAKPF